MLGRMLLPSSGSDIPTRTCSRHAWLRLKARFVQMIGEEETTEGRRRHTTHRPQSLGRWKNLLLLHRRPPVVCHNSASSASRRGLKAHIMCPPPPFHIVIWVYCPTPPPPKKSLFWDGPAAARMGPGRATGGPGTRESPPDQGVDGPRSAPRGHGRLGWVWVGVL